MRNKKVLKQIKFTVLSLLPDAKVLLFGSRARGNYNEDSDFDVLVIIKDQLPDGEKVSWQGKIRKALINSLDAPFDVILNSENEVAKNRKLPGHLIRTISKEGIFL